MVRNRQKSRKKNTTLYIIIILIFIASFAILTYNRKITANVVLDEPSGPIWYDQLGGIYNGKTQNGGGTIGAVAGSVEVAPEGKEGNSLYVKGIYNGQASFIRYKVIEGHPNLNTQQGTIELWINRRYPDGDTRSHTFFFDYPGKWVLRRSADNKLQLMNVGADQISVDNADSLLPRGQWKKIVFTWDFPTKKMQLYICTDIDNTNCEKQGEKIITAGLTAFNDVYYLGSNSINDVVGGWLSADSYIDAFEVFNYAKTEQAFCTDPDASDWKPVKTTALNNTASGEDICVNDKVLKEYYCDANRNIVSVNYDCSSDYYGCTAGKCVPRFCTGVKNYAHQNTSVNNTDSLTDTCIDSNTLREYWCEPGIYDIQQEAYNCLSGEECVAGKCSSLCTPNWTFTPQTCPTTERYTASYYDSNSCGDNSGKPEDKTIYCDKDGDGLIGNETSFNSLRMELNLYISGNKPYTPGIKKEVEFTEDGLPIIWFEYNFNQPLNLYKIYIEKQPSHWKKGYLIVKGLGNNKIVLVDQLNYSSVSVCVKDSEVNDISELSDNCDGVNEKDVLCDGSDNEYPCEIIEDKFVVQNVENSAVMEILYPGGGGCVSTWGNCTGWSSCSNGKQTRTCIDTKGCNSSIKTETQSCTSICQENWYCNEDAGNEGYGECINGEQTRICVDLDNCGTVRDKPRTRQDCGTAPPVECESDIDCFEGQICDNGSCVEEPKSSILLVIISILIIAIIAVAIAIIYFWKKKPKLKSGPGASRPGIMPPPRFMPPPGGMIRRPPFQPARF